MKSEFAANLALAQQRRESLEELAIAHNATIGRNALTKREPLRAKLGKVAPRKLPAVRPVLPAKYVAW